MASLITNLACSAASHPSVKLNGPEVKILTRGGFKIENETFAQDPAAITAKAAEILKGVDAGYASLLGKASYVTGFGKVGQDSELAKDLNKVAADVKTRGEKGSNAEAPATPQGTVAKVKSVVACGVSLVSHTAASYVGKTYRTV